MERSPSRVLLAFACLATALVTHADQPTDLLTGYHNALEYEPTLQAQRHLLDAEREAVAQARAAWRPTIQLEGSYAYNRERMERNRTDIDGALLAPPNNGFDGDDGPPSVSSDGYRSGRASLRVTQALVDRDRWVATHAARQQVTVAELRWKSASRQLLHDVIQQHVAVVESDQIARSLRREYETLTQQYELDAQRHARGVGTLTEVRHAQSRLLLTEGELLHAEQTHDAERFAYRRLTGLPHARPLPLDASVAIQFAVVPDGPSSPIDSAPAVVIARAEEEAAAIAIRQARARYGPTLELVASRDHLDNRPNTVTTVSEEVRNQLLVQLRTPLYAGGAIRSATREAVARHLAASEQARRAGIDTEHDLQRSLNGLRTAERRIQVLEQAVTRSREAIELRRTAFAQGLTTNHEVLDATRELHQAERALLGARYDAVRHYATLRLTTGELSTTDLALLAGDVPRPALDPAADGD